MNNPKLRFKEFASDWKIDNLSDLSSIIDGDRGKNYPKEKDFFDDEFCLFLNAGNVTKLGFDFKNKLFITKEKDQSLRNGKLERNDIVLTTRGTVGNVVLYNSDIPFDNIRINSGMVIVRNKNKIIPEYLYSYMKSPMFESQVNKTNFGSAQPQLTIKGLAKFKVSYPEEKEQIKVSNFLSLLDKKIELQSKKIEDLKLFKMSTLDKYFNKDTCKEKALLKKYCSCLTGKSKADKVDINGKYYIMDMGTVNSDGNILKTKPTFCNLDLLSYGDLVMPKDDIGGGLIIGKTGFIDEDNKYVLGDHVYLLKVNDINSLFLHYQINSKYINKQLKRKVTGSAQLGLKSDNILNQEIYIYSEEEQKKIANIFKLIDRKIELETEKIFKLINLKKGLMQNMFV